VASFSGLAVLRDLLDDERDAIVAVPGEAKAWDVDTSSPIDDLREVGVRVDDAWQGAPSVPSSSSCWVTSNASATACASARTWSSRSWPSNTAAFAAFACA
jgi:hypothetical protein